MSSPNPPAGQTSAPGALAIANPNAAPAQQAPLQPGLYAPDPAAPPQVTTLTDVVTRLMTPPQELYNGDGTVTLTITWAVGVAGPERFERTPLARRHSLVQDDELRERGVAAGLSQEIMDWLRSGDETLTLPESHFN